MNINFFASPPPSPEFKPFSGMELCIEDLEDFLKEGASSTPSKEGASSTPSREPDSPLETFPAEIFENTSSAFLSPPRTGFSLEDFDMSPERSIFSSEVEEAFTEIGSPVNKSSRLMYLKRKENFGKIERASSPIFGASNSTPNKHEASQSFSFPYNQFSKRSNLSPSKTEVSLTDFCIRPIGLMFSKEVEALSGGAESSSIGSQRWMSPERKDVLEKMERASSPVFAASNSTPNTRKASRTPLSPYGQFRQRPKLSRSKMEFSLEDFRIHQPIFTEEIESVSRKAESSSSGSSQSISTERKETLENTERVDMPLFSVPENVNIQKKRKALQPPPTPRHRPNNKRQKFALAPLPLSYEKAQKYNECGESGLQVILNQTYSVYKVTVGGYLGQGQFSKVYSLDWNGDKNQVIKIPNFKQEFNVSSFIINRKNEIINYFRLKEVGFPVISFFNLDELFAKRAVRAHIESRNKSEMFCFTSKEVEILSKNDGKVESILNCHFVEDKLKELTDQEKRIELEKILLLKLKSNWLELAMKDEPLFSVTPESAWLQQSVEKEFEGFYRTPFIKKGFLSFEELSAFNNQLGSEEFVNNLQKENHPLYQLKEMFRLAYENGIAVDLKQDNVRIQEDGKVVLCDLYYDLEEEDENPFHCLVNQKLEDFTEPDSLVWKYLDPRPT